MKKIQYNENDQFVILRFSRFPLVVCCKQIATEANKQMINILIFINCTPRTLNFAHQLTPPRYSH